MIKKIYNNSQYKTWYIYISQKLYKFGEPDTQDTAGEAGTSS